MSATDNTGDESMSAAFDASDDVTRFVPAPHNAAEKAAMEAALLGNASSGFASGFGTGARIMTGAAVLAIAVAVPGLSFGAMGAIETRVDVAEEKETVPAAVWTPAMREPSFAFASANEALSDSASSEEFSVRPRLDAFDRVMPVSVLENGSAAFDLAFAGVDLPNVSTVALALPASATVRTTVLAPSPMSARPSAGAAIRAPLDIPAPAAIPATRPRVAAGRTRPEISFVAPAIRTRVIDIPQVAAVPAIRREREAASRSAEVSRLDVTRSRPPASEGPLPVSTALVSSDASIEAAFAGAIDVSGGIRSALPLPVSPVRPSEPQRQPQPVPSPEPVSRAVPMGAPQPQVGSRAALEAAIAPKTKMDARVNGVLTGKVEFRQLDGTIAIRLRSVVGILRERFSADEFDRLMAGSSADRFIPLAELQSAGVPISYNPAYDEVEFGIDFKDAPNANKVQVQQITTPAATGQSVMIEQIPR